MNNKVAIILALAVSMIIFGITTANTSENNVIPYNDNPIRNKIDNSQIPLFIKKYLYGENTVFWSQLTNKEQYLFVNNTKYCSENKCSVHIFSEKGKNIKYIGMLFISPKYLPSNDFIGNEKGYLQSKCYIRINDHCLTE